MAHISKDGSAFTNRSAMVRHERRSGGASAARGASKDAVHDADIHEENQDGEDVSGQDIHDVVKEHGPANEVHIMHDHESGTHHVESKHGDKMHESDHDSVEEAHEHGKCAAGICDHDGYEDGGSESDGESDSDFSLPGLE
jgi:hypothetical protein